jgi:DNA-binding CsgD family transcriptional regulator
MELNSLIGDIYDAGSSDQDWVAVGKKLSRCCGADAGSLRLSDVHGHPANVFEGEAQREAHYNAFLHLDPFRPAITRIDPQGDWSNAVKVTADLVDEEAYRQSEFYCDFARSHGQDYMLLGAIGDCDRTVIAFYREGMGFADEERSNLAAILPHLQRVLHLRKRVRMMERDARIGYSAFEALPGSAVVVDADLNVLFANSVAKRALADRHSPVALTAAPHMDRVAKLTVASREKAARLRALVFDAAHGGSGGAMRLELDTGDDRVGQIGIFVSPRPPQSIDHAVDLEDSSPVLVLISELSRPAAPKPALLSELFGLSIAEGAVALALLGGQTAETVARERDVSLETVRSQIRTVLRKTDAANLRDFERIGALLTTLMH